MERIEDGSVVSAAGFKVGSAACGIRRSRGPDVALIVCEGGGAAAGVFTTNRFAAAPVRWSRRILPTDDLRAVVANSGNANACTGPGGENAVRNTVAGVASLLGCDLQQVAVCSTGHIGVPLPMEKLEAGIEEAGRALSPDQEAARQAERAILTTDTTAKACAVRSQLEGDAFHVGGMAKGAGMISPHMATMLAFVTTDAWVPPPLLQSAVEKCTDVTFNAIAVDGDTSTNDSVIALASGASDAVVTRGKALQRFSEALRFVMQDLAIRIARDGEGATKLITVKVSGAQTAGDARKAARAVSESLLLKCAIYGEDPNWGRILCAAGYSGADFRPQDVTLRIGGVQVFSDGTPTGADASAELGGDTVELSLDLGAGDESATMWTCDLSKEYVDINAGYDV